MFRLIGNTDSFKWMVLEKLLFDQAPKTAHLDIVGFVASHKQIHLHMPDSRGRHWYSYTSSHHIVVWQRVRIKVENNCFSAYIYVFVCVQHNFINIISEPQETNENKKINPCHDPFKNVADLFHCGATGRLFWDQLTRSLSLSHSLLSRKPHFQDPYPPLTNLYYRLRWSYCWSDADVQINPRFQRCRHHLWKKSASDREFRY